MSDPKATNSTDATAVAVEPTETVAVEATEATTPDAVTTPDATSTEASEPTEVAAEPTAEEIAAATQAAEAAAAALVDAFNAAVATAVEARDTESGEVSADNMKAVQHAFKALSTAQRKAAKNYVDANLREWLTVKLDLVTARAWLDIQEKMSLGRVVSTGEDAAAEVVLDPTTEYVNLITAHYLAGQLIPVPSDVDNNWSERLSAGVPDIMTHVPAMLEYMTAIAAWNAEETHVEGAVAPTIPADMPKALVMSYDIVTGRSNKKPGRKKSGTGTTPRTASAGATERYTGARRSIGKHISEFFAGKPVGTEVKFAELSSFTSSEYTTNGPSSGAIGAYFDRNNMADSPGIVAATVSGVKGAKKVA